MDRELTNTEREALRMHAKWGTPLPPELQGHYDQLRDSFALSTADGEPEPPDL